VLPEETPGPTTTVLGGDGTTETVPGDGATPTETPGMTDATTLTATPTSTPGMGVLAALGAALLARRRGRPGR
jgi:MYXO-CTERM domain-containing protein